MYSKETQLKSRMDSKMKTVFIFKKEPMTETQVKRKFRSPDILKYMLLEIYYFCMKLNRY